MLSSKSDDSVTFSIENENDLIDLQKTLLQEKQSADKVFVATEMASNILRAHERGTITVNGVYVETKLKTNHFKEIVHYVEKAKEIKEKQLPQTLKGEPLRGMGFVTMFGAGWNLKVEKLGKYVRIIASLEANPRTV